MNLGFIIPTYVGEKRVALLPEHINGFKDNILIEEGFGRYLDIPDSDYRQKGCSMANRETIFNSSDAIFCLKLLQPEDYPMIKEGKMIIGWTHPTGSGKKFYAQQAIPKKLIIVDLDNIYPAIYCGEQKYRIDFLPRNFVKKNSFMAGYSSTMHALISYGLVPNSSCRIAILSSGNVSQGAFNAASKFSTNIEMYYRKTMDEFYDKLHKYDIIINGIEVDNPMIHILTKEDQKRIKKNALVIDAAADAGNAIEGSHYTKMNDPIYYQDGVYYYVVNNAPSVFYRNSSFEISKAFSKYVYSRSIQE